MGKIPFEILNEFISMALKGNINAQIMLGVMYDYGQGVPQDHSEAAEWYRMAADKGDADTQNDLGMMYETGRGVSKDREEAKRWYRKAADQGHAKAQNNLGCLYAEDHKAHDYVQAYKWFNLALIKGVRGTVRRIEKLTEKMTFLQIAEAQKLAREWQPRIRNEEKQEEDL